MSRKEFLPFTEKALSSLNCDHGVRSGIQRHINLSSKKNSLSELDSDDIHSISTRIFSDHIAQAAGNSGMLFKVVTPYNEVRLFDADLRQSCCGYGHIQPSPEVTMEEFVQGHVKVDFKAGEFVESCYIGVVKDRIERMIEENKKAAEEALKTAYIKTEDLDGWD